MTVGGSFGSPEAIRDLAKSQPNRAVCAVFLASLKVFGRKTSVLKLKSCVDVTFRARSAFVHDPTKRFLEPVNHCRCGELVEHPHAPRIGQT